MKLEVGRSYRTRAGEKVTIVSKDDCEDYYPFNGSDGETYQEDGRLYCGYENEGDLVALWVDEPATPMYKEGDIVKIQLTDKAAKAFNLDLPYAIWPEAVLSAIKDPEPEFDWSTVKAGMAFKFPKGISWYVGDDLHDKGWGIFALNKEWESFDSYYKGKVKRAPEHDIIMEETKCPT